jgi:hypothetical protein
MLNVIKFYSSNLNYSLEHFFSFIICDFKAIKVNGKYINDQEA